MSREMASEVRRPGVSSLAVLVVALAAGACGGSSGAAGESSPEQTARAYVDAINAHDGQTVCDLMVESAAYEFRIPEWGECPKVVAGYIGYREDSGSPGFQGARILEVHEGAREGELTSVGLTAEIHREEGGSETFEDVIWLVEKDGGWRLARASGILYAAFSATNVPDDVFEAPDLAALEQAYEAKVAAEEEQQSAEDASFGALENGLLDCAGPETSYDDARGDLHFEGSRELTPEEAERYASADVRRVEVATESDDICVRVTFGGSEIEESQVFRFDLYSLERNPTSRGPEFKLYMQVNPDGRARLAYEDPDEEDDYGRNAFVPVTGRIARDGDTFSFRVARADLSKSQTAAPCPGSTASSGAGSASTA
jgi:hypothetical protein